MINVPQTINYSPFTIDRKAEVILVERNQNNRWGLKFLKSSANSEDDKANQQQYVIVLC